jgi:hypothetical protein
MIEAGFALENGDPTSPNKWLHIRIAPIYSSYKPSEKATELKWCTEMEERRS